MMSDLGFKAFAKDLIEKVNGGASESDIIDSLSVGYSIIKGRDKALNLPDINNSEAELCRCLDYEGTAEDGTCYYCRRKLCDDYPA